MLHSVTSSLPPTASAGFNQPTGDIRPTVAVGAEGRHYTSITMDAFWRFAAWLWLISAGWFFAAAIKALL